MNPISKHWQPLLAALALLLCCTGVASAHAIAGQRLFPSTLTFDDPGIGAELPIVFNHIHADGADQNDFDISVTKPITPRFSLIAGTNYLYAPGDNAPGTYGWGNFTIGGAWQVYVIPATESIASFSFTDSIGNSGSRSVRDNFSTYSPEFDFGQGFGALHTSWLRPFAVSGAVSVDFPTDPTQPHVLNWALSLQYSIPYLQDFVKYAGIGAPFNNMIPIIELPMQTCLDRGCYDQTTGYVAPGVIWIGHYVQVGIELEVPVNHRTGNSVGVLFGFDFYLDDIAPHSFGAPLFG